MYDGWSPSPPPGKRAGERLQAQLKKAEADTLKERQDLERLRADLEKKGPLLKEEERRNLELDFQKRSVTLQRTMGDLQQEIQLREREMMQDILKDLEGVVNEIGKADKFTLILDRSQILFGDQGHRSHQQSDRDLQSGPKSKCPSRREL